MRYFAFILTLFTCFFANAQKVNGIVYDSIAAIENIKIVNLNTKKFTVSNKKGQFTIPAKVNDTLHFSSIFYHEQTLIINASHTNDTFVIELKKINNELEEVVLKEKHLPKLATIEEVETNLHNQILEDIKNNPHLYGKLNDGGIDFIQVFSMIGKLFKNKNKQQPIQYATYEELISNFENSKTLDQFFFKNTLKIQNHQQDLFIQYIEASYIDSKLLKPEKEVYLIEYLVQSAKEFNAIVKAYKEKD